MSKREMTPDEIALCRAVDLIVSIPEKRIETYRRGTTSSTGMTVYFQHVLDLIDAIEEANPGWIERTRKGLS